MVGSLDLSGTAEAARTAITRPPDVDSASFVSWGNISQAEASAVLELEADVDIRAELLEALRQVFAPGEAAQYTLFYGDPYRGK